MVNDTVYVNLLLGKIEYVLQKYHFTITIKIEIKIEHYSNHMEWLCISWLQTMANITNSII